MDKHKTAKRVERLQDPSILSMPQISFQPEKVDSAEELWKRAKKRFSGEVFVIKPQRDGCSTGVVRLHSCEELKIYLELLAKRAPRAKAHTFRGQLFPIEMPTTTGQPFLLEPFIRTDKLELISTEIRHISVTGWCEMTIGVLQERGGYRALSPSITVAEQEILSVEEKFQGGTGINITPPPLEIFSIDARQKVQESSCKVAEALGIQGYVRLDLFVHLASGTVQVIEANTLPALTPSTVFYQQALSESSPLFPKDLLCRIIAAGSP